MEMLNFVQMCGYGMYGMLYIVINNQIGFMMFDLCDVCLMLYCIDVVKMIEVLVLYVNGDDLEVVVFVIQIVIDYWMQFYKDVVIDIVCFCKLGYNEQDMLVVMQLLMYKKIVQYLGICVLYVEKFVQQGVIIVEDVDNYVKVYCKVMDDGYYIVDLVLLNYKSKYVVDWVLFLNCKWMDVVDMVVLFVELKCLGECIMIVLENFKVYLFVECVINDCCNMVCGDQLFDWGMGEYFVFVLFVVLGYLVCLMGQDLGCGMFMYCYVVLYDQNCECWNDGMYVLLQNIVEGQVKFMVIDLVLLEEVVLGFEYGYLIVELNMFVLWEVQFGDFVNGVQVVIDQFILLGEVKWGCVLGFMMLLLYGYEGQGLEYLLMCIECFL